MVSLPFARELFFLASTFSVSTFEIPAISFSRCSTAEAEEIVDAVKDSVGRALIVTDTLSECGSANEARISGIFTALNFAVVCLRRLCVLCFRLTFVVLSVLGR